MTRAAPPGVQNERTALAWHRTALSLMVAAAGLSRFAYERVGYPGLVCLAALPLGAFVFRESRHRYRHRDGGCPDPHARGGTAGVALVWMVFVLCATGLVIVLRW